MADELLGLEEVLATLEEKLGEDRVKVVVNKALRKAGDEAEKGLTQMSHKFVRTGATTKQIVKGNVSWADYGIPRIKIGWRAAGGGESPRWNIEHLNEFGYTRDGVSYSPRGFGQMQNLIDEQEISYPKIAQEELKELLR